ncbi:MAG TPA: TlpA disulfide reductase family protein, partial [Pirellulaceae bacterium]
SLHIAASLGDAAALADGDTFAKELGQSSNAELSRAGRLGLCFLSTDRFLTGVEDDPRTVIEAITSALRETPDRELFDASAFSAQILADTGHPSEAAEAYRLVGETFIRHKDVELAGQAKTLLAQAQLLDLEAVQQRLVMGEVADLEDLAPRVRAVLSLPDTPVPTFDVVIRLAEKLEESNHRKLAASVWDEIDTALGQTEDRSDLAMFPAEVTRARRRLNLVGTTFRPQGTGQDGSAFEAASLRNHVVLVVFWQSTSNVCRAELTNLTRLLEQHSDSKFVALGISLDEDRGQLANFLQSHPLAWTTLIPGGNAPGIDDPNAVACGVSSVPFLVLLDQDQRVRAYGFRVDEMVEPLQSLLAKP